MAVMLRVPVGGRAWSGRPPVVGPRACAQSAVRRSPSASGVAAVQPSSARGLVGGGVPGIHVPVSGGHLANVGWLASGRTLSRAVSARSRMVVRLPLPILNDSPKISGVMRAAARMKASQASST